MDTAEPPLRSSLTENTLFTVESILGSTYNYSLGPAATVRAE